jgi:hypothetical protein
MSIQMCRRVLAAVGFTLAVTSGVAAAQSARPGSVATHVPNFVKYLEASGTAEGLANRDAVQRSLAEHPGRYDDAAAVSLNLVPFRNECAQVAPGTSRESHIAVRAKVFRDELLIQGERVDRHEDVCAWHMRIANSELAWGTFGLDMARSSVTGALLTEMGEYRFLTTETRDVFVLARVKMKSSRTKHVLDEKRASPLCDTRVDRYSSGHEPGSQPAPSSAPSHTGGHHLHHSIERAPDGLGMTLSN